MKYKVGDKVKIREDLDVDKMYGAWDCSIDMARCGGMIATIVNCYDDSYHIDVDNESYDWTDEMFEDTPKFHIGDKVRVRSDLEVNKDYNGLTLYNGMYQNHDIMTINSEDDKTYMCEENTYWWGEDMLEKVEENTDIAMTVEDLLNKTDVEHGGLIIAVYYPNSHFEVTIGHNKINRNSELYKRFIKAYGDMIVDEVSFDIRDCRVVMRIKVDYAD